MKLATLISIAATLIMLTTSTTTLANTVTAETFLQHLVLTADIDEPLEGEEGTTKEDEPACTGACDDGIEPLPPEFFLIAQ